MLVTIPRGRSEPVRVTEVYGLRAGVDGRPDVADRVVLERRRWRAIAPAVRADLNARLRERGHRGGRWAMGETPVERLLGRELCVLAWAVEQTDLVDIPAALANWAGLKPEERWWLYHVTAAATGGPDDAGTGWRKALRYALAENPVREARR